MNYPKLVVLISGNGSNLQAIIDSTHGINPNITIRANVVAVISNRKKAYGLERARKYNIPAIYLPFKSKKMDRIEYDKFLANEISKLEPDLIILAGWMHILSNDFLKIHKRVINLHPALPGEFPGKDAIGMAYQAFKEGKTKRTGAMVHWVIPELDAGEPLETIKIKILNNDFENDLRKRVQYYEKELLLKSINKVLVNNLYP